MRGYVIAAVTLSCVGAIRGQENVVPNEAIKREMERAQHALMLQKVVAAPKVMPKFSVQPVRPDICAIPLLEAKVKPMNDHIAPKNSNRTLDTGMAHKPAIPACPAK